MLHCQLLNDCKSSADATKRVPPWPKTDYLSGIGGPRFIVAVFSWNFTELVSFSYDNLSIDYAIVKDVF
jgi:hypothetical protein